MLVAGETFCRDLHGHEVAVLRVLQSQELLVVLSRRLEHAQLCSWKVLAVFIVTTSLRESAFKPDRLVRQLC